MNKKIITKIKLTLKSGKATPMPPIGPALGQYNLDIASFCKEYNLRTKDNEYTIIPVEITVYDDKSFIFILKTPPTSRLLLQFANIEKGSINSKHKIVGTISNTQLEQITKIKLLDLNTNNLKVASKIILGTAKNMGIMLK